MHSLQSLASSSLAPLEHMQGLTIKQQKEWGEILTGWETKNRYRVLGDAGEQIFMAGEVGGGIGAVLLRGFLQAKRPFEMQIKSAEGDTVMELKRPWRWFFSTLHIFGGSGQLLGTIQQRFKIFGRLYEIQGPSGEVLATIEGPFLKPWTFNVNRDGREVGKILKKWSGFGKEVFTDADSFRVEFGLGMEPRLRPLLMGATFLIDFVHFENRE